MHVSDGTLVLSATDLSKFLACGQLTVLDRLTALGLQPTPPKYADPALEVLFARGLEHEEAYLDSLKAEGESYDVEITNPGNFPLVTGIARLTVEPLASTKSRVSFRMAFKPKFGPLGWVMGKTVMTRQCRKILGQVLSGLEQHAKTGEVVSRKPRPAAAA